MYNLSFYIWGTGSPVFIMEFCHLQPASFISYSIMSIVGDNPSSLSHNTKSVWIIKTIILMIIVFTQKALLNRWNSSRKRWWFGGHVWFLIRACKSFWLKTCLKLSFQFNQSWNGFEIWFTPTGFIPGETLSPVIHRYFWWWCDYYVRRRIMQD